MAPKREAPKVKPDERRGSITRVINQGWGKGGLGGLHTSLEAEIDIRRADDETKNGANEDGADSKLGCFFGGIGVFWEGIAVIYEAYPIQIIGRGDVDFAILMV